MTSDVPLVSLRGITKMFGQLQVLHGIDLDIAKGEIVAVLGPSGSGKTTLLRSLNVLERPTSGSLTLAGTHVVFSASKKPTRSERVAIQRIRSKSAMVFQSFNLFPHMTALANVIEGLISGRGMPRAEAEEVGRTLLDRMGLGAKAFAYPATLSGGQKQRVAIARGLAMQPEIMLFDEPTSALDPELRRDVLTVLREIAQSGMTMIIVTHEMSFAQQVADRILFMEDGEIHFSGEPKCFFSTNETRIERFLGGFI